MSDQLVLVEGEEGQAAMADLVLVEEEAGQATMAEELDHMVAEGITDPDTVAVNYQMKIFHLSFIANLNLGRGFGFGGILPIPIPVYDETYVYCDDDGDYGYGDRVDGEGYGYGKCYIDYWTNAICRFILSFQSISIFIQKTSKDLIRESFYSNKWPEINLWENSNALTLRCLFENICSPCWCEISSSTWLAD